MATEEVAVAGGEIAGEAVVADRETTEEAAPAGIKPVKERVL